MLWVGVYLPALSLESFAALAGDQAAGLSVTLIEQHRVVGANAPAREAGVQPGMKRATALALAPTLLLGAADAERDAQALQAVAHVLLAFTPCVTLVPPQTVLAEVQASLRCFGGPARLWQRLHEALAPLGHQVQMAHAPSAQAAALLACRPAFQGPASPGSTPPGSISPGSIPLRLTTTGPAFPGLAHSLPSGLPAPPPTPPFTATAQTAWQQAHQALGRLPIDLLVTEPAARANLQAMGLQTLADLRRQPRGGLTRRFGAALLNALDRAWGDAPDPRGWAELPLRFESRVELWARADNTEALLGGAAVLLARLLAWAQARHARVLSFELVLHHETRLRANSHGEAGLHVSTLAIALAEPTGDTRHLQAVLRERLARAPLEAPVLAMGLRCDHPVLGPPPNGELFPSAAGQREGLLRLLERLQARLGPEGVQRLGEHADHRPERATTLRPATELLARGAAMPATSTDSTAFEPAAHPEPQRLTRPVWLLQPAQALPERHAQPCVGRHELRLLTGPERIEAGWWDGDLVARDYFIAQAPEGELLWIYRLRPVPPAGEPGWFLHGRFG